ncbi:MAG: hypothetical protein DMD26_18360 [Gemmatimonadetes bacterium]|nr:MAG: hypothetical protein DMD26_18360 [Gemmatimonadota bacterium]
MSTSSRSDDRSTSYAGDAVAPASAPAQEQVSDQEFEALLIDMLEPAYRLGFRLTNDKQDAEDLVQEAALRAFRFRHTFQRGSSFKAWFYRIVINQFYTGTRRKRNTTTRCALASTAAGTCSRSNFGTSPRSSVSSPHPPRRKATHDAGSLHLS